MKLTSSEWQAKIGRNGGKARARKLTPEERIESARNAAAARWSTPTAPSDSGTPAKKDQPKTKKEKTEAQIEYAMEVFSDIDRKAAKKGKKANA